MSDNELDELLCQLKDACKKNRHHSSNETNLNTVLKKIDVFINRRQMKLLNHQKRLDELQRDLLLSEQESSDNRVALEKKGLEVHQLHALLNKAEQTTQNIINNYAKEVETLTKQLTNVQQECERSKGHKPMNEVSSEMARLREFNKMLEIDNQRLYAENDRLKRDKPQTPTHERTSPAEKNISLEKLIHSLQRSNQEPVRDSRVHQTPLESKIKTLENDITTYKTRSDQQEIEIHRIVKDLHIEREQHQIELDNCRKTTVSIEIEKLRSSLSSKEEQCNSLRLELQRVRTEKEMLKVRLLEQKMAESSSSEFHREMEHIDYEKFIRNELETNIDQANKLINYWNYHKQTLEEKIRQLTDEIQQMKKENQSKNDNDLSLKIYQCNENVLYAKREMNKLQMEITDKNTIIYNLHKKIECLEQALMISKQRTNAQLSEIEELRSNKSSMRSSIRKENKCVPIFFDRLSTNDEAQLRRSTDLNRNLCTSSPIKSADVHKYFRNFQNDSLSSTGVFCHNRELIPIDHDNSLSR